MKIVIAVITVIIGLLVTNCFAEDRYDYNGRRVSDRNFSEQLERDQREFQERQREQDRKRDELDRWYK